MTYYVDDIPAESIVIDPSEAIDLDLYVAAAATLHAPAGSTTVLDADIVGDVITVTLPDDVTVFPNPGIYRIRVSLEGAGAVGQSLPDVPLVVVDPDSVWHNIDTARAEWQDAEHIPDVPLDRMLTAARNDVTAYAPLLADPDVIPQNYRDAQLMQARNRWNAKRVAPDGSMGQDDFIIRPFPLDWHVKATLRPKRAVGGIA